MLSNKQKGLMNKCLVVEKLLLDEGERVFRKEINYWYAIIETDKEEFSWEFTEKLVDAAKGKNIQLDVVKDKEDSRLSIKIWS